MPHITQLPDLTQLFVEIIVAVVLMWVFSIWEASR